MSDRVWITAESKVIPFEQMSDAHVDNALDWCNLRVDCMQKQQKNARTNGTINRELARVTDLRYDLQREQQERRARVVAPPMPAPGTWVTITATRDGSVNGTRVKAGDPFRFFLAPGRQFSFVQQ